MQNFKVINQVDFPRISDTCINMMPFIMGDNSSIPGEYHAYLDLISACNLPASELSKVGYLTITESFVEKGSSQRRGGVHTEKHPASSWGGGWGGSVGGLYMASNVDDSCMVWDRYVDAPGPMGDCEHLRAELGEGRYLKKNELTWMTDGTPHESMPLKESSSRQFFRLVTSEVSLWYEDHSTKNRLGIQPSCKIVRGSKF